MTTPRVTVPVEPAEEVRDAVAWLEKAFPKDAVGFSTSYRPTMTAVHTVMSALSAATAPEVGAVMKALDEALIYIEKLGANIERNDLDMHLDTVERPFSFAQTMRGRFPSLCAALATREEAPAEAGEITDRMVTEALKERFTPERYARDHVYLEANFREATRRQLAAALRAQPPALPSISLDGPNLPDEHRVWLARQLLDSKLTDEEAYGIVRHSPAVKPPAREDAQPFGYWVEHRSGENPVLIRYGSFVPASDHYKITTLYTHPAPDALRAAVEALEPFNRAYQAYLAAYANFMPSGATEAEKRFAEGERKDTAEEAAFEVLSKITLEQLCAVNEALAALQAEHKGRA